MKMGQRRTIVLLLTTLIIGIGIGYMMTENSPTIPTLINSISQEDYDKLKTDYAELQETIDAIDTKNLTRTDKFSLEQDSEKQFTYDAGCGIIWEIDLSHVALPESRIICTISWRQGEEGAIVNNGWVTLETAVKEITGSVETEVYENDEYVTIKSTILIDEHPKLTRVGIVTIPKTS